MTIHTSKKKNLHKNFPERVRDVVRGIPKGSVLTYGDVAHRAGKPGAARAVGTIMRKNYDETIPCHRVIRADGTLGGYNRGGIAAKRAKLRSEGCVI